MAGKRSEGYPFIGYIYRPDGYHHGGEYLYDKEALERFLDGPVRRAIARGVEVMVTDNGDCAVFHAKDGEIVWPKAEQVAEVE